MIVEPLIGRLARQQVMQRAAQAVNVGPMIDRGRIDRLLGRHVVGSANHSASHRHIGAGSRTFRAVVEPSQAEVGDFDHAALVAEQIVRLDIAVNDPLRMSVGQASCGLQNAIRRREPAGTVPRVPRTPPGRVR